MKPTLVVLTLCLTFLLTLPSWITRHQTSASYEKLVPRDSLRKLYEKKPEKWPKPFVEKGVTWEELGALKENSEYKKWVTNDTVKLGKLLFFDPRLSKSNQVSCSSCHDPDLTWQDSRIVSLGNDHLQGIRNTPSILNVFIQKELFWDGRSSSLQDQAIGPLVEHHEMNMDVKKLPRKLQKIKGYKAEFTAVFGTKKITLDQISTAIASFERTLRSRKTKFDQFMEGKYNVLTDQEVHGLHLFRTKARCLNCHHGIYLTDLDFHNIGLTYYGREYEDLGRYNVTGRAADVGKFKTPSLRGIMRTRPWMHNGLFDNLSGVINMYNSGMHQLDDKGEKKDTLYPQTDPLLKPLNLTKKEKEDLVTFLKTLSGIEYKMPRPKLPE